MRWIDIELCWIDMNLEPKIHANELDTFKVLRLQRSFGRCIDHRTMELSHQSRTIERPSNANSSRSLTRAPSVGVAAGTRTIDWSVGSRQHRLVEALSTFTTLCEYALVVTRAISRHEGHCSRGYWRSFDDHCTDGVALGSCVLYGQLLRYQCCHE